MESGAHGCADAALALYEQLLSPSLLDEARRSFGLRGGGGLFHSALTIWLGIRRRLGGGLSVEQTWLSCSIDEVLRLSPRSSRAKSGALSPHASGFDYARRHLPLELVRLAADVIFSEAQALLEAKPEASWYLIDGSSLTLERTSSLAQVFPAASNQHGPIHWLIVKVAVAHDLYSGLSMRPEWGPMHGPNAVSEQEMAYKLIERLPAGCGVIADRNFGILQVAWALRDRPMLVRLTDARAKPMLKGKGTLDADVDVPHTWNPSAWERSHHQEFKQMSVPGRIVVRHVLGPKGKKVRVCLFTNDLSASAEDLTLLYTKRWNVETDLRTLKQTLDMELVRAQSPDMVAKELVLGIAAYNIVRTIMAQAAELAGVQPRRLSFARAKACIEIFVDRGSTTPDSIQQMLVLIAARKQPERKTKRSFSREVWARPKQFPSRHTGDAK
jgi:putative transposase